MSQRLLIAVGDAEPRRRGDGAGVRERRARGRRARLGARGAGARAAPARRRRRRCCTTPLGTVPVMDVAREIAASFPEVGMVLLAAETRRRSCCAPRCRPACATSSRCRSRSSSSSPASAPPPSGRATCASGSPARSRPSARSAASLIAVAGAKGGVGTTTVAIHLALAAARSAPGRPVCLVDFDLQKGDMRAYLDTPLPPQRRRPRRGRRRDLRPPPAGDAVHAQEGFRLLLAPDDGERAEEVDSAVARNVLGAVRRATR